MVRYTHSHTRAGCAHQLRSPRMRDASVQQKPNDARQCRRQARRICDRRSPHRLRYPPQRSSHHPSKWTFNVFTSSSLGGRLRPLQLVRKAHSPLLAAIAAIDLGYNAFRGPQPDRVRPCPGKLVVVVVVCGCGRLCINHATRVRCEWASGESTEMRHILNARLATRNIAARNVDTFKRSSCIVFGVGSCQRQRSDAHRRGPPLLSCRCSQRTLGLGHTHTRTL